MIDRSQYMNPEDPLFQTMELSQRDRELYQRWWHGQESLKKVATAYGISRSRVQQIVIEINKRKYKGRWSGIVRRPDWNGELR